jgi:hypothetical protein
MYGLLSISKSVSYPQMGGKNIRNGIDYGKTEPLLGISKINL